MRQFLIDNCKKLNVLVIIGWVFVVCTSGWVSWVFFVLQMLCFIGCIFGYNYKAKQDFEEFKESVKEIMRQLDEEIKKSEEQKKE